MVTGMILGKALDSVRARGGQIDTLDNLAAGANDTMRAAKGCSNAQAAAAFLATCMMESAYMRTTTEYLGKPGTAVRKNQDRYFPYIGRGAIQCTWRENYAAFGRWAKSRGLLSDADQFVNQPTTLGQERWFWLTALWYFDTSDLWGYAQSGNFKAVSNGVNRGNPKSSKDPNGWPERQAMYTALLKFGDALLPDPPKQAPPKTVKVEVLRVGSSGSAVRALQAGLVAVFPSYARIAADGSYGENTRAAVVEFQRRSGLTPDGVVGPATREALRLVGVVF